MANPMALCTEHASAKGKNMQKCHCYWGRGVGPKDVKIPWCVSHRFSRLKSHHSAAILDDPLDVVFTWMKTAEKRRRLIFPWWFQCSNHLRIYRWDCSNKSSTGLVMKNEIFGERKIIFKSAFGGDMFVPFSSQRIPYHKQCSKMVSSGISFPYKSRAIKPEAPFSCKSCQLSTTKPPKKKRKKRSLLATKSRVTRTFFRAMTEMASPPQSEKCWGNFAHLEPQQQGSRIPDLKIYLNISIYIYISCVYIYIFEYIQYIEYDISYPYYSVSITSQVSQNSSVGLCPSARTAANIHPNGFATPEAGRLGILPSLKLT